MAVQSCIQRFGPLLLIALSLLATAAGAQPLTIAEAEGRVEYRQGGEGGWRTVTAGATLALPGELRTGPDATARLVQGDSSFRVRGGTRLGLASRENRPEGLLARVRQWLGTVFYRVERQPDTFSVETPFLVSTVKGTRFIVVSTETASFVTLTEGSLEVRDLASNESRLLSPGDVIEAGERHDGLQGFRDTAPAPSSDQPGGDAAPGDMQESDGGNPQAGTGDLLEGGDGTLDAGTDDLLEGGDGTLDATTGDLLEGGDGTLDAGTGDLLEGGDGGIEDLDSGLDGISGEGDDSGLIEDSIDSIQEGSEDLLDETEGGEGEED